MTSILIFAAGAALLVYSAEKLIVYLVGAAGGLHISVFLLAIVFTGIEFDDVAFGVVLNVDDLGEVALGTVFGTATAMTGIVLALTAIVAPTRVNIPRSYLVLFALAPLAMIPCVLVSSLTATYGVVLVLLFVAFIGYVAAKELRSTTPVFRNAEILERVGASGPASADVGTERPTDRPPFAVTVPFTKERPLPGWAGIGLAVVALAGLIAGAALMSEGTAGILDEYEIGATVFGATIATLVLSLEDIVLTVEPTRRGAPEIGVGNVIGSVVFGVTAKLGIILLVGGSIVVGDDVLSLASPGTDRHDRPLGVLHQHRPAAPLARVRAAGAVHRLLVRQLHDARASPDRDGLTVADQSVVVFGRAGPSSRSSRYGSPGQASRRTCRGTVRPA